MPDVMARYEEMAEALLDAYRTGTPAAMERHWRLTWHRRAWEGMRTYVQVDLGRVPGADVEITLDDARWLVAREHGFGSWEVLQAEVAAATTDGLQTAKPVEVLTRASGAALTPTRAWARVQEELRAPGVTGLDVHGQATDDMLRDLARVPTLEVLRLGGSAAVSNAGLQHLRGMPALRELDLSQTRVTDAGMDVLRTLPQLERVSLAWTHVTDAGAAALRACDALQSVNLLGSACGDGAVAALAGKPALRELRTGAHTTDAALPLLHDLPVFATWTGAPPQHGLLRDLERPNHLQLQGAITARGMAALRGLDGLYCLHADDSRMHLGAEAITPLLSLPRLGELWFDAHDDAMPRIAQLPHLRSLVCQDTDASDAGWVALAASRSIEQVWGRRCHGLGAAGFRALSRMPALRGLSVSCLNVPDEALAVLPEFPALRELMPMDVPDAGYRHIGTCANLTALLLMYCRDTTDAATAHLGGLRHLTRYFASYTRITDRTPELLSHLATLEEVTFDSCAALTDAGIAALARLPRLRELRVSGRHITPRVRDAFGPGVTVHWGL